MFYWSAVFNISWFFSYHFEKLLDHVNFLNKLKNLIKTYGYGYKLFFVSITLIMIVINLSFGLLMSPFEG